MQRRHVETAVSLFCSVATALVILIYANSGFEMPQMTKQTLQTMQMSVNEAVTKSLAQAGSTAHAATLDVAIPKVVVTTELDLVQETSATCSAADETGIQSSLNPCQALIEKIEVSLAPPSPKGGELCEDVLPVFASQWLASNI